MWELKKKPTWSVSNKRFHFGNTFECTGIRLKIITPSLRLSIFVNHSFPGFYSLHTVQSCADCAQLNNFSLSLYPFKKYPSPPHASPICFPFTVSLILVAIHNNNYLLSFSIIPIYEPLEPTQNKRESVVSRETQSACPIWAVSRERCVCFYAFPADKNSSFACYYYAIPHFLSVCFFITISCLYVFMNICIEWRV